jgi:hypothetical protein
MAEILKNDKQGRNNGVHKHRRFGIHRTNRAYEVKHDDNPGHDPGNTTVDESCPVGFLSLLIVEYLHDAKQVHGGIDRENQNNGV